MTCECAAWWYGMAPRRRRTVVVGARAVRRSALRRPAVPLRPTFLLALGPAQMQLSSLVNGRARGIAHEEDGDEEKG
ncbi:hypothetical protein BV22DRAFT_1041093 [Leucogyrophana mollusca]|uniref:Uncharacterized protein n=1 Tax=Leucogyrophana mollusca TaxID=85980 RepID=A0ACB8B0E6_9AGAM|nr:hypothetical protein BV22DRAFT_1041093 [Leucogyrophana mollusca]